MTDQSVLSNGLFMKNCPNDLTEKEINIILAATEVFSEKGFHQATVEAVSKKAGVGKGTIYLYFKDKEDLFGRMISYHFCELGKQVENILATQNPLLEKLKRIMTVNLDTFIHLGWLFEEKNLEITHRLKKSRDESRQHEEVYYDTLAQLFHQGETEGVLRSFADHRMAASTVVACLHAAGVNYSRRKPEMSKEEYTQKIIDFVLFGMARES